MEKFNPNKVEKKFTRTDFEKVKTKSLISSILYFFLLIACGSVVFFMEKKLGLFQVVFSFLFVLIFYSIVDKIYYNNPRKDFKEKTKIITQVKVLNKRVNFKTSSDQSSTGYTEYIIEFEKPSDISHYYLSYENYSKIRIGDVINLEYSKHSNIILKMTWKNESIENKNYFYEK